MENLMLIEKWKDIKGYENIYQASTFGNIKRLINFYGNISNRILKPQQTSKYGHSEVRLYKLGKYETFFVHRIILETFVDPCPPGMECRHLDGNPGNNRLDNLCWGTRSENQNDRKLHETFRVPDNKGSKNGMATHNEKDIIKIREMHKNGFTGYKIAKILKFDPRYIYDILNRKR